MMAPARMTEFKGNVAAVLTENYWDVELAGLRSRQAKVHDKVRKSRKELQLDGDAAKSLRAKLEHEEFTDKELETLAKGVSNLEYHYLGSAKIMTQIGKGFAEAMYEMVR